MFFIRCYQKYFKLFIEGILNKTNLIMELKGIKDGWTGLVSDEEWERHGYKKIKNELPNVCKEISLLGKPQDAYAGHRTEWIGIFIGNNKVIVPNHFKTDCKEKPLSDFTHWKYGERINIIKN